MMCASPACARTNGRSPAEKFTAAFAGKRSVTQAAGNLTVVQSLAPILPLPIPATVMTMDDRPYRLDAARSAALCPSASAVRSVGPGRPVDGRAVGCGTRLGELPIRYHLEHCIGRDLADLSRLAARGRTDSVAVIVQWPARPGPTGDRAAPPGCRAAAPAEMSGHARRSGARSYRERPCAPARRPDAAVAQVDAGRDEGRAQGRAGFDPRSDAGREEGRAQVRAGFDARPVARSPAPRPGPAGRRRRSSRRPTRPRPPIWPSRRRIEVVLGAPRRPHPQAVGEKAPPKPPAVNPPAEKAPVPKSPAIKT